MTVSEVRYRYSDALSKNFRKQQVATLITFLTVGGIWTLWQTEVVIARLTTSWPLMLLTVVLILVLRITVRRSRHASRLNTSLQVAETGLIWQQNDRHTEQIDWPAISQVIVYTKQGAIYATQIIDDQHRTISLAGFEPAQQLKDAILASLAPTTQVQHQEIRIDWRDPYMPSYILVGVVLPFYLALNWTFGEFAIDIVLILFRFGIALFILSYKPVKRVNENLKYIDFLIGVTLLIFASVLTVLDLR